MSTEDIKKKILQMYEAMGLDVDDITDEELSRIASYYHKNLKQLEKDLLNILDKREDDSKGL